MQPIETEGLTVAEAVAAALLKSGLRRDQVEWSVLEEGSPGFLGLGAKPARVRLSEKRPAPNSPAPAPQRAPARDLEPLSPAEAAAACDQAEKLVCELLGLMRIAAPILSTSWDGNLERVKISVESQDASLLVGRDGRVLESLQFLATLMLSRGNGKPVAVQVDALSYWEKREQAVLEEARRAVETVKATGKPVRMEPMDAAMRRLIHRTFRDSPDVMTSSEGEGPWRKLVIRARKG